MSTIASPRPSFSSRRSSASTIDPGKSTIDRGSLRRNRAALRDYYNLSVPSPAPTSPDLDNTSPHENSELDAPGFDPETYVANILASTPLEGVLKISSGLVSEIRSLDGEKKALVYDNYSKLIAATDTIRSMREKMDPMTPTTSTLSPAIGHIAETAADLRAATAKSGGDDGELKETRKTQREREVVRWVLDGPQRIRKSVDSGEREAASREWKDIEAVLEKLGEAKGVERVRKECKEALDATENG